MMDFISVPLVVGIVCAGIYGLFELFVRKRERLNCSFVVKNVC